MLGGIDNQLFLTSFGGFFALLVLIVLLKWTFARGKSVVERPIRIGSESEYGLLVAAAQPDTHIEGQMMVEKLKASGIKSTLTQTTEGPRVMVFKDELKTAQAILRSDS